MKIGLVTYNNYNYGSSLQCYATQRYLDKTGNECVLIEKKESRMHALAEKLRLIFVNCLISPGSIKLIKKQITAQSSKSLTLSKESLKAVFRFKKNRIISEKYTNTELKKIAHSSRYDYFFSGSDQVWNGARTDNYDLFFLRFAPKEKRVAWAPSFGGEEITKYNRSRYKKYIGDYFMLSVREKSGEKLIHELTGRESEVLCDPVMLLSGEEWRNQYRNNTQISIQKSYVLAFFIDEPSEKAISFMQSICKDNTEIISFGYEYEKYNQLPFYRHLDGNPYDFLAIIDHAAFVVTDSYHATVFSALFHTKFAVFERKYTHFQNQSVRILDFLNEIKKTECFEPNGINEKTEFYEADSYFERMRIKADEFLYRLSGKKTEKKTLNKIYPFNADCCGCAACVDVCPKNAVSMKEMKDGIYPFVDDSLCVECGKCEEVCGQKKIRTGKEKNRHYYIARSSESGLEKKSASGGIFATLACEVLKKGGVVYGAALASDCEKTECKHIRIDREDELFRIQNSKYVQSYTEGIFKEVKRDLLNNRTVLFSGTSCQVSSLNNYIKDVSTGELITVDLICHGVPSHKLLNEYLVYLSDSYGGRITDFTFRNKEVKNTFTPFNLQFLVNEEKIIVPLRDSAYYRLYMSMAGFRSSCYDCKFARSDKPADITLGDFFPAESKSDIIRKLRLDVSKYYSCIIVHSKKGELYLSDADIVCYEISKEDAVLDHAQLSFPAMITPIGEKLLGIYTRQGFKGLQKYINRRNRIVDFFSLFRGKNE